jgi:hypothetical protein
VTRKKESTLQELVDWLLEQPSTCVMARLPSPASRRCSRPGSAASGIYSQVKRPSLSVGTKQLFLQGPPDLREATAPNLEKTLGELFESGSQVAVTDAALPFSLTLQVDFA